MEAAMVIILFTGLSASGKTTLSRELAAKYNIVRIDAHQTIHDIAIDAGYERGRDWVKAVGSEEVYRACTESLIKQLNYHKEQSVLFIDEIVDKKMLNVIQTTLPMAEIVTIYIKADPKARLEFMGKRIDEHNQSKIMAEIDFIDGLKMEAGLREIIESADAIILNRGTVEELMDKTEEKLQAFNLS